MVNNNMVALSSLILGAGTPVCGALLVKSVDGNYLYANSALRFPAIRTETYTLSATAAGVSFGTGGTAPTPTDANLEQTITSGIVATLIDKSSGVDAPGDPYLEFTFTITNTSGSELVIREVGYKQELACAARPGETSSANYICLLDRTVLDRPLTLAAGDCGVLKYKLKTRPVTVQQIGGVDIVSWEWGSDEQIAAMIAAAHAGTIDLQRDALWRVGAMRKIHVGAFTGSGNVAFPEQDIDIVIASFDDYNGCGCVLQFDFAESLSPNLPLHAANTNVGGYGMTDMKTTTLPALIEALPSWLREHLLPFDVLTGEGNASETIEPVSGNRLALRSEIEVFGSHLNSAAGEGQQIEYYKMSGATVKRAGYNGGANPWWLRSPDKSNNYFFCTAYVDNRSDVMYPTTTRGCSPFGCL